MSASHCDECRNGKLFWYSYRGGEPFDVMKCDKGHKPRFYKQRNDNPMDTNYGWKRTCGDFQRRGILTPNACIRAGVHRLFGLRGLLVRSVQQREEPRP